MKTLQHLFMVSRPISWPNTAFPFAATYLYLTGVVDSRLVLGTLFFLIPYNLLMYGVNDVYDYESDLRNPRKGGIEGAKAAKRFHRPILIASYLSYGVTAAFLAALSDPLSLLVLAVITFFVLAYSLPGLRFKERPVLDSITSSIHFVGPMVYALTLVGWAPGAWPLVIAFFLWGMASHAFGAVQDINADRSADISSIATHFGARTTVWFAFILYLASAALMLYVGGLAVLVAICGLLYAANIYPYLSLTDTHAERSNTAWRRFIYLNLFTGFIVTLVLIASYLAL